MKSLAMLIVLLSASLAYGQDYKQHIGKLNSDSFHSRERAEEFLRVGMNSDPEVLALVKEQYQSKLLTLEQRLRLKRLIGEFYHMASVSDVPIWSMPDRVRFKDDKDIAEEYYKKAQLDADFVRPRGIYNHSEIMRYATRLYLADQLESYQDRQELNQLLVSMKKNWIAEQELVNEVIQNSCYCGYMEEVKRSQKPKSFKDRMKSLREQDEKLSEQGYTEEFPKDAVVDHDESFYGCCG